DLRVGTLTRLVERLSDYFQPFTARGVACSLKVWHRAAADCNMCADERTHTALIAQTKRWRDLLLTGLDPITLLPPERFLARARQVRTVIKSFWPELALGGVFALAAAAGGALLVGASSHRGWATFLSVLGAAGITS